MNTVWALLVLVVLTVVLEGVSLLKKEDNWWTITGVHKMMPKWVVAIEMLTVGMLIGHFWM